MYMTTGQYICILNDERCWHAIIFNKLPYLTTPQLV